jgi:5'-deoxynucleotidase YfbR-like HD superfamily hydrolase
MALVVQGLLEEDGGGDSINTMESSTPKINTARLLQMALVHDLAECTIGDITPYCGVSDDEKHTRELHAMQNLTRTLPNGHVLLGLWQEYEAGETPEARICKDLDKLEMILQAAEYETDGQNKLPLDGFFDSTRDKWRTSLGAAWGTEIEKRRPSSAVPPPPPPPPPQQQQQQQRKEGPKVQWKRQLTEIIHDRASATGGFVLPDESMHSLQMSDSLFTESFSTPSSSGGGQTGALGFFLKYVAQYCLICKIV